MKLKKVHTNLPATLVDQVDKLAAREFTNRTELIKRALTDYLRKRETAATPSV
jgi:metal-responsive CopG/Arc/MetJ family transcriptional regulator